MKSAGGTDYPPEHKSLQAIIREPYNGSGESMRCFLNGTSFRLISKVSDGILYLDGPFIQHPVKYEQRVDFKISTEPLSMILE
jgi:hypothetical protein